MNLALTKVTAYAVYMPRDRNDEPHVEGYYFSPELAKINAKGVGHWGNDGSVTELQLYIDGSNLYEVKLLGKFKDVDEVSKKQMVEKIRSKLTEDEWKFLEDNK